MGAGTSSHSVPYDRDNFQRFKLILENDKLNDNEKFIQFRQIFSARVPSRYDESSRSTATICEKPDQVSMPPGINVTVHESAGMGGQCCADYPDSKRQ